MFKTQARRFQITGGRRLVVHGRTTSRGDLRRGVASRLLVRPVATGHDQLHDFTIGRMTGLPSHIKRRSIKRQYQYSFNFLTEQC